ncbi:MAG: class F sortase [Candidatus Pacebacteria bacterium]|nr:class F sortase [Candidatus Paceibacterota bacterium]
MTKNVTNIAVATVTAAAFIVFMTTLARAVLFSPEAELSIPEEQTASPIVVEAEPTELPDRLVIPTLGIDAKVQHVGLGKSGNMAVPSNYTDVGWYRYGPVPGARGSAVIDGHLDNGFGMDAVFKHIEELKQGDLITVVASDGTEQQFEVESVISYPREAVPLERVFNRDDRPRLNLITCTGDWNNEVKSYDQRVVVYAVLV